MDAGTSSPGASVCQSTGLIVRVRFLLDEDLHPRAAEIGRGLGLAVRSVHEIDRRGYGDREQLRFAATEGRIFVTRNRDDFVNLTVEFYQTGEPHCGVLIVPCGLLNNLPERISHALKRWFDAREGSLETFGLYHVDFLAPSVPGSGHG